MQGRGVSFARKKYDNIADDEKTQSNTVAQSIIAHESAWYLNEIQSF